MPAKGNEEHHHSSSSSSQYESLFRDCNVVDSLVYDIKENLKLTHAAAAAGLSPGGHGHSGGKMKGGRSHAHGGGARGPRLHPYSVPPSSRYVAEHYALSFPNEVDEVCP